MNNPTTENTMTETTTAPARSALTATIALASTNVAALQAEADRLRSAQANYAAILARAAAGEEVPELEYEAAEHTMAVTRRRIERRFAIAGIQARAVKALIPAARAETEQQAEADRAKPGEWEAAGGDN